MEGLAQKENQKRTRCPGNQVKEGGGKDPLYKMSKRGAENGKLKVIGLI